ncbi:MAG: glycoside hydrolase family 15 protein [Hamadaea sp.]|nr:glycoside hydrolase family 15 protein [Hamadaea sp.]NUR49004.1 glycoside hydrolase family 15 protein [Hamadaea sp.]
MKTLQNVKAEQAIDTQNYVPIAEHGLIGNLRTAALADTTGAISWYCPGRFDAPSVFASLLDPERGGLFRIAPIGEEWSARQLYLPDSAVLVTRFLGEQGVAEVVDFMPVTGRATDTVDLLVRMVRVVRGEVRLDVRCAPRFDYGRADHTLEHDGDSAVFRASGRSLRFDSDRKLIPDGEDITTVLDLAAGEEAWFAVSGGVEEEVPRRVSAAEIDGRYRSTLDWWHRWVSSSAYRGRWRETIMRSAITLKLLTYSPTGALVAAPTAGLPEQIGGERNWDYRYAWIRDASLSVHALLRLGYVDEARRLFRWLSARPGGVGGANGGPLQIMYRVDGSSDLDEHTLSHLDGYRSSRPVRIGNGAAHQLQLDIYGEMLDAIWTAYKGGAGRLGTSGWERLCRLADWVAAHWDQPDEGIWETRGGRKHFVYARVMSWVALDRTVRLARELGWPAETGGWIAARDEIHKQVMSRGWSPERRSFVQAYGSDVLDAALLVMPLVGFISDTEPKWLSTLDAIGDALVSDSLVYRYDPLASPDGLRGHEGTFSMCTFWYVETLARAGRLADARFVFEKMLTYGNHVGLYAEELGLHGEHLGNFPQAFTHLALINAAVTLNDFLDTPDERRPAELA